jgi:hypothetical protein
MVLFAFGRHCIKVAPLNPKRQRIRSQTRPGSFNTEPSHFPQRGHSQCLGQGESFSRRTIHHKCPWRVRLLPLESVGSYQVSRVSHLRNLHGGKFAWHLSGWGRR